MSYEAANERKKEWQKPVFLPLDKNDSQNIEGNKFAGGAESDLTPSGGVYGVS